MPHIRQSEFRNLGNFCLWNPKSSYGVIVYYAVEDKFVAELWLF